MNRLKFHFFIPARRHMRRYDALNLLLGVYNGESERLILPLRIMAEGPGGDICLLETPVSLRAESTSHLYLTVPSGAMNGLQGSECVLYAETGDCKSDRELILLDG